MEQFIFI